MIRQFGIHLKVKDMTVSYEFYKSFHLKEVFAYGTEDFLRTIKKETPRVAEKYNGVTFDIGNALFEIADGHIAVKKEVFQKNVQSSKISAMLHVKSIREIVQVCRKRGYPIVVLPKTYPWGTKEVVVKDPDGFVLVFIEKLKH